MKKIKQFLVMLLVISLSITSLGSTVFAAGDFSSETQDEQITDSSQNLNVEGTDSVGDMLASVISEENNNSEERKQSANNITGLEIEDDTAVVEFQTQTDAEVVVAVYDEQRVQMLASGNEMVSQDENMATVTISGDMPQYFAATAYLLDADSHEPLCEAYNTELYTKDVQDLKNSTADDYDLDKVLQLDEDDKKTNFAVFNEETTVADEGADKNQLNDNGDGTYTITNADSSFTDLKVGDTFSYNYEDGTVLLVKVADISVKGTTVTVRKDTDTDLTDYFDYVKIETDEVQEDWNVDNSDLEEGVTAADSEAYTQASRIGGSGSSKYSTSWNIYKNLDKNVTIIGSFKYSFSFTIDVYITAGYQYLSVKDEYSAGIEVDITGKSKLIDIPLGRISTQPIICVKVELIPAFLVETSGSVTWSGEIKGSSGGAYDSNSGFKNLSSSPSCQSSLKVEGKIFMGVKVSPSVSIVDSDLANASLGFSGGAEIAASYSVYDTSKDQIHECKKCLKGEVKSKLSMELTVKLIKGKVYRKRSYDLGTVKTGDFYYSIDYDEFGWTTCPHVCYPVKISVTDKDGKAIKGTSTVRVADSKTGEVVEIRDKTSSMESVELTDSKETKVYLPNGSYIVRAVKDKLEGEAKLTVHDRGTQVVVKLDDPSAEEDSGKDGNITWRLTKDGTLYISGQGDMPDYDWNKIPWRDFSINKVVVQKGITSIGSFAFAYCRNLSSIKIPEGVTSIGSFAFEACSSLNSIKIPKNVSEIGISVFDECYELVSIYFKGNKPKIIYEDSNDYDLFSGLYDTTVYYPKNNKTWEGIESESFGGTNIKWVAYDPASLKAAATGEEVQSSESPDEGVEFTDNPEENLSLETDNANEDLSPETDDPEEDPSIEPEEDAEEVPEPSSSPDQEKADTNEKIEDDFGADDVEITELDPTISNEQEETKAGDSVTFSRLIPHSRYLFVMVRDEDADDLLEASNLLYIGQKTADESGTVSFRYMLKESFGSPVSKIFGKQLKDIKNMTITLAKTKYVYDGTSKKPSVTVKDGTKLLRNGQDYTVTYSKNVDVGTATVTVTGKGDYTGTSAVKFVIVKANNTIKASNIIKDTSKKTQTVKIKASVKYKAKLTYSSNSKSVKVDSSGKVTIAKNFTGKAVISITSAATSKYNKAVVKITVTVRPSGTVLYKLTNNTKGRMKVTWKKNSSVSGYRIQYSIDKNFKKGVGTVTIGKNKTTSGTLSKLKKGKTYYVRIATYKNVRNKVYSSWSKVKKITIKK